MFAIAFLLLEIIEGYVRHLTADGVHFQQWSSETMMQAVSVRELRNAPIESLWYLHIQPPVHNALRAIFAHFHNTSSWADLINRVDQDLYHAWALAAAALAALVDAWLRQLGLPRSLAGALCMVWFLHPANLGFATLLDATLLSALATAWILYEIWRLARAPRSSLLPLGGAVLLCYFTRSVYQWPFVVVILTSLLLLKVPRRQIAVFAATVGVVVGLYSIKQAWLFGTVSTTTLQGTNLANAISAECGRDLASPPSPRPQWTAAVLTQASKADGTPNFNHADRLDVERRLMGCFRRTIGERSLASLGAAYAANFQLFIRPSSNYASNPIVDRALWRRFFDDLFSGRALLLITLGVGLFSAWRGRHRWRAGLAVLLPAAYVLVVSVAAEHGENMRFKFFLEPALYVWWAAQAYFAARAFLAAAQRFWVVVLEDPPSLQAARGG